MPGAAPRASLSFLFRSDRGTIARGEWLRGAGILAAALVALTAIWVLLSPYANRGLDERGLVDPMTLLTYVYLVVFAFAVILIAVSYVNLSAKRLRAIGRPPALAGALPFAALLAGAAHWLRPRVADVMPIWIVIVLDVAALIAAILSTAVLARSDRD